MVRKVPKKRQRCLKRKLKIKLQKSIFRSCNLVNYLSLNKHRTQFLSLASRKLLKSKHALSLISLMAKMFLDQLRQAVEKHWLTWFLPLNYSAKQASNHKMEQVC